MRENFTIDDEAGKLFHNSTPKVLFNQELQMGKIVVPVKIEIDFSGIDPSHHEDLLRLAYLIYAKDTVVHGK